MLQGEDHLVVVEDLTERKAAKKKSSTWPTTTQRSPAAQPAFAARPYAPGACGANAASASGALLLLDIDHFKTLNETYGHEVGDQLLRQVAELAASCHARRPHRGALWR